MFLKSLTLQGFKSFADKTRLEFEPGITVIVGPNGSGKSNIVDALTWVLGTHSAKSLRGGLMADVIFAGSADKPALGRAAVEMTIDNSAGTLPIDYSEVAVGRAMFSSGENSYRINDAGCRALDVQELLSDTGLGRENHTIVGQGQLDAVLNARPEDRRAFIEEAAGILKHRRRKERALRKLAQMDSHVERMSDVLRELRRNLRPLQRQAEAAARHAELQAALHEVRVLRAVRELASLQARWDGDRSVLAAADAQLAELEAAVAEARRREADMDSALSGLVPEVRRAAQTHLSLAGLVERWRGLTGRIEERRAGLLDAAEEPVAGRDPDALRARAREERENLATLERESAEATAGLEVATAARQAAEQARRQHQDAAAAEARRLAASRERRLRWEGEVAAARSRLAQAAGEQDRLGSQLSVLRDRTAELAREGAAAHAESERLDGYVGGLAEALGAARSRVVERAHTVARAAEGERHLERRRASLEARAEALRSASEEPAGAGAAVVEAAQRGLLDGVDGALAARLRVEEGMAQAVAAALGTLGEALVVRGVPAARRAIEFARDRAAGRVLVVPGEGGAEGVDPDDSPSDDPTAVGGDGGDDHGPALPGDGGAARPVVSLLSADAPVERALRRALADIYVVSDLDVAADMAQRHPHLVFVTTAGDVAGARGWAGGTPSVSSTVVTRAAADDAERELVTVVQQLDAAAAEVAGARADHDAAQRALDEAGAESRHAEGLAAAAAERVRRLDRERGSAERELAELQRQADALARDVTAQRERLAVLEARGGELAEPEDPAGPDRSGHEDDGEARRLEDALSSAREAEVQARLHLGAVQQRGVEAASRADALEQEARDVEHRLEERERRRVRRLAAVARCEQLAALADTAVQRAERSLALSAAERDALEARRADHEQRLAEVRAGIRELDEGLAAVREQRHDSQLRRQELAMALEGVRTRLATDLGVDPDEALRSARPDALDGGSERDDELAAREDDLARKKALLGVINPLALEEFRELEERHGFLTSQLEDLRRSKRDLLEVVAAVDTRIQEVFGAAFADVASHFERIFPRLFPGGEGRLVLTDPEDLLETGVEVEARPPGKRVKRLSLLSGGERSLTALAVLFAIFAARPSPFYVLDEVEAALDDVNLQRLLSVVKDFRGSSQLLIVTHQKRTMEVADAIYGVTMQSDGVSRVVGQRLTAENRSQGDWAEPDRQTLAS